MTLPPDDSDFDGLDRDTKFRIESLAAKPVEKLDAGNPQVWFWFDGRGRDLPLDSASGQPLTGAPVMISRIILLAVIAIISVAAYFAGSGAFKPYSAELFDLFSQRTATAPASLPKEETLAAAAATNSDQQLPTPNDFNRSPERPLSETQTQTPVAAAKSTAATQTTASLSKEALATAATNFDHDQLPALNDLSRSPAPLLDTDAQSLVAGDKSVAAPQATAPLPKEEGATAATTSDHDKVSGPNDLSRSPERPVADTQTETPVATAESIAAPPSGTAAVLSAGSIDSVPANASAKPTVSGPAAGDVSPRQSDGAEPTIQGVTDKEVLFGMAPPFSGASRELGRQMQIGVETAFGQINSAGGPNGRLLRLVAADDGYDRRRQPTRCTSFTIRRRSSASLVMLERRRRPLRCRSLSTTGRYSLGRSPGPVFFAAIHPIATCSTIGRAMPRRLRPWCTIW